MGKLTEVELKKLIHSGETNTLELKVAAPRATEMAERLCGMANGQGGLMIIGVRDSTREIVGIADHKIGETLDVISRAVRQMIKPELMLDPVEPEMYIISGKKVVIATVKSSHGPVYQAHGIYWIRRGTHTVLLGLSDIAFFYDCTLIDHLYIVREASINVCRVFHNGPGESCGEKPSVLVQ